MPCSGVHTHRALFYKDDCEYLEGLSEFLSPAVAAGEPVALALPGPKLELARKLLNGVPDTELLDMSEVGRNPGRILSVIGRLRERHRGRTLHYVGEPIWPGRGPDEIREAVRHEALINLALAGTTTRVLCPYDAGELDTAVLKSAERTHPELVEQGATQASFSYREAIPPECEMPLSAPPAGAVSYEIGDGDLRTLRAAIRDFGSEAALGEDLLGDLQVVATELASNALQHGTPPRQMTLWQRSERVVCQVDNEGAISDPLAGRRHPEPTLNHGMGLWIVHHLSDLVEVRTGARTTVRAHLAVA